MVAAMGLGAGEAALEIAIPYAKQRIQFKTPLSEKQGYTHKLIVPNVVRLAAAETYIDEVAERLDAGEKNLEVEGSIAKWFATEAGNRAAEDCIQALGGYGYIAEYGSRRSSATCASLRSMRARARSSRTLSVPSAGKRAVRARVRSMVTWRPRWTNWRKIVPAAAAAITG